MNPVHSGIIFLVDIILMLAIQFILSITVGGNGLSMAESVLVSEGICLVPASLFAILFRAKAKEAFRFNYVRPSTLGFTALMVLLLEPLLSALNAFTMLFTENVVAEESAEIVMQGFPKMAFLIAVIAPLAEELLFRGIILSGLRNGRRIILAIVLQAVMFGFMHMNLNQMLYACALGFFFGLIVEITDSVWPSIFAHAMVNMTSVIGIFMIPESEISEIASGVESKGELMEAFAVSACLAVLTTALACCTVVRIAKNEPGGMDRLQRIFQVKDGGHVMSLPSAVALGIAMIVIIIELL
ncbi:MAG: CPBP family intramembrane metalloprotease [Lachnospiraceae bacterium]|nr:CPBP family intramembrane metalloprotease [Lachnospiraceae bacterium]